MAPKLAATAGRALSGAKASTQDGIEKLLSSKSKPEIVFSTLGRSFASSDGRRAAYNQLADDAAAGGKKREAAMLLSAAEKHLELEEPEACQEKASQALSFLKEMGESAASEVADATRLVVQAQDSKAFLARAEPEEALKFAAEEGEKFKTAGNKRGQACMLLSIAEMWCDKQGKGKQEKYPEAMDKVTEALPLFQEVGDKKMEAKALLVQGYLHFRMYAADEALTSIGASLKLFEELEDKRGKAQAQHAAAVASMLGGKFAQGIKEATEAMDLYKANGDKKLMGAEALTVARWSLMYGEAKKALASAELAMSTFQETSCGKGWEGASIVLATEAQIEMKNAKNALKLGKDAIPKFKENGDWKSEVLAQDAITRVHLAMEAPEKALKTMEEARQMVQEKGDKVFEAKLMHGMAATHLATKSYTDAIEALQSAVELADEAEDEEEGAAGQRAISFLRVTMPNGDYKEALKAASAARDLSQQAGDKFGEAADTLDVAIAQAMLEENSKATSSANEAQELFQELKDIRGEANALQLVAELKMLDNKVEPALEAAEERLTIVKDLDDPKLEAKVVHQIGTLHLAGNDYAEAEKVLKQGLAICTKAGDAVGEAEILISLLQVHMAAAGEDPSDRNHKPNVDKAMKAATDAVAAANKSGEKGLRASAMYFRSMVLMWSEKFQDAGKQAAEAKSIFLGMGSESGEAKCLIIDSQLKLLNGNENGALDTLDRAMGIARGVGDDFTAYDAANIIQQIQGRRQQFMPMGMMPMEGMPMQAADAGAGEVAAAVSVAAQPKGLDPGFVRKQLMTFVKDVMASDEELELDSPFMEAGMDSLSSVSLMSMVAKEFQMALSPSLVFDFPTVRALEDHLVEESKSM